MTSPVELASANRTAAAAMPSDLRLNFGFSFADLYRRDGLIRLDALFQEQVGAVDPDLHYQLLAARAAPEAVAAKEHSNLLVELAQYLDIFIADLLDIRSEVKSLTSRHAELAPIFDVKRNFVQRRAVKQISAETAKQFDGDQLAGEMETALDDDLSELRFAECVQAWLGAPERYATELALAERYAAWAVFTEHGKAKHRNGVLFKVPHKVDPARLVPIETQIVDGVTMLRLPPHHWRERDGFALTDPAPISEVHSITPITASGAIIRARTAARRACARKRGASEGVLGPALTDAARRKNFRNECGEGGRACDRRSRYRCRR